MKTPSTSVFSSLTKAPFLLDFFSTKLTLPCPKRNFERGRREIWEWKLTRKIYTNETLWWTPPNDTNNDLVLRSSMLFTPFFSFLHHKLVASLLFFYSLASKKDLLITLFQYRSNFVCVKRLLVVPRFVNFDYFYFLSSSNEQSTKRLRFWTFNAGGGPSSSGLDTPTRSCLLGSSLFHVSKKWGGGGGVWWRRWLLRRGRSGRVPRRGACSLFVLCLAVLGAV